ncbi:MAG: hypothetical protein ACXWW7_10335, partial [Nocardioides sp.]
GDLHRPGEVLDRAGTLRRSHGSGTGSTCAAPSGECPSAGRGLPGAGPRRVQEPAGVAGQTRASTSARRRPG